MPELLAHDIRTHSGFSSGRPQYQRGARATTHKPAVLGLVDEPSARATAIGAANAVVFRNDGRAVADHVDGVGFVSALRASDQRLEGRRALIVGSGGVGSAIAFGVAEGGASQVSVSDIDHARAQGLAERLEAAGHTASVAPNDPAGFELVVNATPLGMRLDDPLPFDCARLEQQPSSATW